MSLKAMAREINTLAQGFTYAIQPQVKVELPTVALTVARRDYVWPNPKKPELLAPQSILIREPLGTLPTHRLADMPDGSLQELEGLLRSIHQRLVDATETRLATCHALIESPAGQELHRRHMMALLAGIRPNKETIYQVVYAESPLRREWMDDYILDCQASLLAARPQNDQLRSRIRRLELSRDAFLEAQPRRAEKSFRLVLSSDFYSRMTILPVSAEGGSFLDFLRLFQALGETLEWQPRAWLKMLDWIRDG